MTYTCAACSAPILLNSRFTHFVSCLYCKALNIIEKDSSQLMSGVDIAVNFSVLQIGTTFSINKNSFKLIGRLVADSPNGAWNEWFVIDQLGQSYWLSESFGYYHLLREINEISDHTNYQNMFIGGKFFYSGEYYYLQSKDKASCVGVEGELPISVHLTHEWLSLDFRSPSNAILFINVNEKRALFYPGTVYEFNELNFANLKIF